MDEYKTLIDAYHQAGIPQVKCAEMINSLNLNGHEEQVFEYLHDVYSADTIKDYNLTDAGNAEYFVSLYGDSLRYDHSRSRWLRWHEHYWKPDDNKGVTRLALKSVRRRYQEAAGIDDLDRRKDIAKWAIGSEQKSRIESLLSLAKDFNPIADNGNEYDTDKWLFCVKNGVIDLKTGTLRDGLQDDRITMQSPVVYDPFESCPRWETFINEIFNGDTELINWWKLYCGYSMTGTTNEQIVPIGYGAGANGKRVLKEVLLSMFGDYGYDAPFSTFELYNRAAIPNDLAALSGKRFVTASETNQGTRLNEARVKALTGGDSITARFLNHEYFTFQPQAKFFLAVNHRPRVADDSFGFWRRVRLIPFTQQFIGENDDKNLLTTLKGESSGILNWMIEGCLEWVKYGLSDIPNCITNATEEYKSESDPVSEFLIECCVLNDQAQVKGKRFYTEYKTWCEDQGFKDKEILTNTAFGRIMGQKFTNAKKESGKVYFGIGLKTDGFLTGFEPDENQNRSVNILNSHEGFNKDNPSEPVISLENPSLLGMTSLDKPVSNPSGNKLPDCPECKKCEWTVKPDGSIQCSCGFIDDRKVYF